VDHKPLLVLDKKLGREMIEMNATDETASRTERVKRWLMVWCALILFVLGVWLLIRPLEAQSTQKVDNVVAAGEYPVAALGRQPVRLAD
jgi:hypothetical protein